MKANLKAHGIKFDERVLPRLNMTQLFYYDPDGIAVECNFAAAGDSWRGNNGRRPSPAPSPAKSGKGRRSACSGSATPPPAVLRRALLDRHAPVDAVLVRRIVPRRTMIRAAVVPDHDVADPPLVAVFAVRLDHVAGQLLDQLVALLRVQRPRSTRSCRDRNTATSARSPDGCG